MRISNNQPTFRGVSIIQPGPKWVALVEKSEPKDAYVEGFKYWDSENAEAVVKNWNNPEKMRENLAKLWEEAKQRMPMCQELDSEVAPLFSRKNFIVTPYYTGTQQERLYIGDLTY